MSNPSSAFFLADCMLCYLAPAKCLSFARRPSSVWLTSPTAVLYCQARRRSTESVDVLWLDTTESTCRTSCGWLHASISPAPRRLASIHCRVVIQSAREPPFLQLALQSLQSLQHLRPLADGRRAVALYRSQSHTSRHRLRRLFQVGPPFVDANCAVREKETNLAKRPTDKKWRHHCSAWSIRSGRAVDGHVTQSFETFKCVFVYIYIYIYIYACMYGTRPWRI